MSHSQIILGAAVVVAALAGCQVAAPPFSMPAANAHARACVANNQNFRSQVTQAQATLAGAPALEEFPLLHTDRFLAALASEVTNTAQAAAWIELAAAKASAVRRHENAVLPVPWSKQELERLDACAEAILRAEPELSGQVIDAAARGIGNNYLSVPRWLGLYPALRPLFRYRIGLLHDDEQAAFHADSRFERSQDYQLQPATAGLTHSLAQQTVADAISSSPLAVPQLAAATLSSLFALHAPVLHVEQQANNDLLGAPYFDEGLRRLDTAIATIYTLPSYTRFDGANLLQLNYVFWFAARQPDSWIDLYAGDFDSIVWRVTLDTDGQVLLYDSIHSCGCYHKYFVASPALELRDQNPAIEPANIFRVHTLDSSRPVRLVIDSNTHFIVGLDNVAASAPLEYALDDYAALYQLPAGNTLRNLFDHNGILPGSERLERFTLWPTGIRSVGAMRQWGVHATGFVEKQHFDDAYLLDKYFKRAK